MSTLDKIKKLCSRNSAKMSSLDKISSLPDDIIERILGRLPIREAVRTSILSRNWRYKWATLPNLVFEALTLPSSQKAELDSVIISGILLQHKGTIRKFSLSQSHKTMTSYPSMDQCIQFLSDRGDITEFVLKFTNRSRYKIHSSLFSCVNISKLELHGCIIPSPPPPTVFNDLTSLVLEYVTFNNEGFESLIAKCPQLSYLRLLRVKGIDRLNIQHASKLTRLYFSAKLIKHICLMDTPSLLYATLYCDQVPDMNQNLRNGESISLTNNLNSLSNLRTFVLGSYYLKSLAQYRLPSTFYHLWYIEFYRLMFQDIDSMSSALDLIKSSPNLSKLVVTTALSTNSSAAAAAQLETVRNCLEEWSRSIGSLNKLRYVEMKNISGLWPEMQFIKVILGNSPLLEQMKIERAQSVNICKDRENEILKELIQFRRASGIAEIIYK